jgi:hypothetical protein
MPHQRKSSIATFLVIYATVILVVGVALFFLWKENERKQEAHAARMAAIELEAGEEEKRIEDERAAELARRTREKEEAAAAIEMAAEAKRKAAEEEKRKRVARETKEKPTEPAPVVEDTGEKAKREQAAEIERRISALYPLAEVVPLVEIVDHWQEVPRNAYPKLVTLKVEVEFEVVKDGQVVATGKLPVGSSVIPLDLNDGKLTVSTSPSVPFKSVVLVEETDFRERIEERYDAFVAMRNQRILAQREAERARLVSSNAKEEELAGFNDGSDARFDPMKESLKRGEAGAFELENATEWRWLGKETVDGVEYDVGLAAFEVESAFGVTRTEIKALIKEGSVEEWVHPATGQPL